MGFLRKEKEQRANLQSPHIRIFSVILYIGLPLLGIAYFAKEWTSHGVSYIHFGKTCKAEAEPTLIALLAFTVLFLGIELYLGRNTDVRRLSPLEKLAGYAIFLGLFIAFTNFCG